LVLPESQDFGIAPVEDLIPTNITAPEALVHCIFSRATDVFSFGMLMWEVWECETPMKDLGSAMACGDALVDGKRPAVPLDMPTNLAAIMTSCWTADHTKRPSAGDINKALRLALKTTTTEP